MGQGVEKARAGHLMNSASQSCQNLVGGDTLYITKMKSHGHNSTVDDKGLYLVEKVGKPSKIRLLI